MKEESNSYIGPIYFGNSKTIILLCETSANPLEQTNLMFFVCPTSSRLHRGHNKNNNTFA